MKIEDLARAEIRTQPVYEAGRPISHVAREYGLDPDAVIKLASNENPLGPSPKAVVAVRAMLSRASVYPDAACYDLSHKAAAMWRLNPDQFIFGNGSNELLELLGRVFLERGDEVVAGRYAFIVYRLVTRLCGATFVEAPMTPTFAHDLDAMAAAITPRTKIVFFTHPNNPTGGFNSPADILAFARALPEHVVLCFDEAYAEYMESAPDLRPLIAEGRPIICCRTFSKIYGCAGFRLGYGYGPADLIGLLQRARQPFNVNALAQAAGLAAMDDRAFVKKSRENNVVVMKRLNEGLSALGFDVVPSAANFVMAHIGDYAVKLAAFLQSKGVIVRGLVPYRLPDYLRITVGLPEQNERVLALMAEGAELHRKGAL